MDQITKDILCKLYNTSLEELAETLPTTMTSDTHILKAEECLRRGNNWDAFHHFSLTHSTLMYHRISHKQLRPQNARKNSLSSLNENEKESFHSNVYPELKPETEEVHWKLRPSASDETKQLLEMLPSDWTVVQVTSEHRMSGDQKSWKRVDDPFYMPTIYISRCRCGTSKSVTIQKISPPSQENSVRSLLQEMELIKGENKVISKYYKNDQEKYMSKREEVNNRLRALVKSMDNGWLRHFSCLLVGCLPPNQEFQVKRILEETVSKSKLSISEEQLSLLMLMATFPVTSATSSDFEFNLRAGVAAVLKESVRNIKVKNLTIYISEAFEQLMEFHAATRNPVILILDKSVVSLPWEMTQALQGQPVTRMPSLQSLVYLYLHHSQKKDSLLTTGINSSNGFFILDPEGNLPRSQERLAETFDSAHWEGVRGTKPSHEQFMNALTNKDVFVYVGHGSGSQYMPAQLVETVECRSLVLLYGCSSAALARRGTVPDPWGVILNYLIASCPCVVGMLWEVMDKDTDLLTKEMVRALRGLKGAQGSPLEDPPTDVALLVAKARPLCSWYLISASLVVYGLPLQVISH